MSSSELRSSASSGTSNSSGGMEIISNSMLPLFRSFKDVKTRPVHLSLGREYSSIEGGVGDDGLGASAKKPNLDLEPQQQQALMGSSEQLQQQQDEQKKMAAAHLSPSKQLSQVIATGSEEVMVRSLCVACSQSPPVLEEVKMILQATGPGLTRVLPKKQKKPWLPLFWLCNSGALSSSSSAASSAASKHHHQAMAVLRLLVDAWPASVYEKDEDGMTPLHLLARSGGSEGSIRFLVQQQNLLPHEDDTTNCEKTSLTDVPNKNGILPLHYALRESSVSLDVVKLLYPTTSHEIKTSDGWTFVHIAARVGNPQVVEFLISRDRDSLLKRTHLHGAMPLHLACLGGSANISSSGGGGNGPSSLSPSSQPITDEQRLRVLQLLVHAKALRTGLESSKAALASCQGNLPLHLLCSHETNNSKTSSSTSSTAWLLPAIQSVARAWPDALSATNAQGSTPLDLARRQLQLARQQQGGSSRLRREKWITIVEYLKVLSEDNLNRHSGAAAGTMSRLADETYQKLTIRDDNNDGLKKKRSPPQQQQQHAETSYATAMTADMTLTTAGSYDDPISVAASLSSTQEQRLKRPPTSTSTSTMGSALTSSTTSSSTAPASNTGEKQLHPEYHRQAQSMDDACLQEASKRRDEHVHAARRIEDIQAHAQRVLALCSRPIPGNSGNNSSDDITLEDLDVSRKDHLKVQQWIQKLVLDPTQDDKLQQLIALNDFVVMVLKSGTARYQHVKEREPQVQEPSSLHRHHEPSPEKSASLPNSDSILELCCQVNLDADLLRRALQDDVDGSLVQQQDGFDNCALHLVSGRGNRVDPQVLLACVVMLVEADPHAVCVPNKDRMLPLHIAVREGAPFEIVQYILSQFPDAVKTPNRGGSLPLHVACANGSSVEVIQLLEQAWPTAVKVVNHYGWNALHSLCAHFAYQPPSTEIESHYNNCSNVAMFLIQKEPSLVSASTYKNQDLPLHMACERGAPLTIIHRLVQAHTSSVQTPNAVGQLALHKASSAMRLSLPTVRFLVQQSPQSVMTQDGFGETPLDVLRRLKSREIDQWLVQKNIKRAREDEQPKADDETYFVPATDLTFNNLASLAFPATPISAPTTMKKLHTALDLHDGRAVALLADSPSSATSMAAQFACEWQEASPKTRFGVWLDASTEDALRQGYLSAIARITSSTNKAASDSSKRARLDLQYLGDELVRVLWLLPRSFQWMIVLDNVQQDSAAAAMMSDTQQRFFFSHQSNWWNSKGRILVTTTTRCWDEALSSSRETGERERESSRLFAISVDQ